MKSKAEYRSCVSRRLKELSRHEIEDKSAVIRRAVFELNAIKDCSLLMTYVSKQNEVSTLGIIDEALAEGKRVAVPMSKSDGTLEWYEIDSRENLRSGSFGILEPVQGGAQLFFPPQGTPLLVPGLAFTKEGVRLGRGYGYFDRYLLSHRGPKIGLAFEVQIFQHLPTEHHDAPVDMVVTEEHVYVAGV